MKSRYTRNRSMKNRYTRSRSMKSRFMKNRLIPADRIRMSANPGKAVLAARAYCGTKKPRRGSHLRCFRQ